MEEIKPRRGRDYGSRRDYDVRPRPRADHRTPELPPQSTLAPITPKSSKRLWWLFGLILVLVVALSVGGTLLVLNRHSSNQKDSKTLDALSNIERDVSYPLYYPAKLPSGFEFNQNSLITQGDVVNFSYSYGNGKQIIVTEQPKPRIMEEVKKIRDIPVSVGEAYIADLGGQTTGFIITDKTLVILSNAKSSETSQLVQLISNIKPL